MEEDGRKVCMKEWEVSEIKEAVQKGLAGLPNLGSFNGIDPITESDADLYTQAVSINMIQESPKYISSESVYLDSESDNKWFEENEDIDNQIRNVFDCFDNENENVWTKTHILYSYIVIQHDAFFFLRENIRLTDISMISIFLKSYLFSFDSQK